MKIILDTMDLTGVGLVVYERSIEVFERMAPLLLRKQKDYARTMKTRGEVKTYFKPITVKDVDITFHLIPSCLGKSDLKKHNIRIMVAGEFKYRGDRFYSMLIKKGLQISIFTTHFLERYVERHLADDSPINFDTFFKYLRETDGVCCGFQEGDENRLQWATTIGNTCGCVLHPRVLLHKTFIDKTTLVNGKKKAANDKGNALMEYFELDGFGDRMLPSRLSKYFNYSITSK